ncbi:MAG: hypothetical protein ACK5TK_07345 [Betaproteobacteria bacterium]
MKSIKTLSYSVRSSLSAAFFVLFLTGFWLKARKDAWHWDIGWVALWAFWPALVAGLLVLAMTLRRRRGSRWLIESALTVWILLGVQASIVGWPAVVPWSLWADAGVTLGLLLVAALSAWVHACRLALPADAGDKRMLRWPGLDVNLKKLELIETVVPLRGNWTPMTVGALGVVLGGVVKTVFADHLTWVIVVLGVIMGIGISIYMGRRFAKGWMLRKLEREFGNGRLFDLKETLG